MDYQKLLNQISVDTLAGSALKLKEHFDLIGDEAHQKWINKLVRILGMSKALERDQLQVNDPELYDDLTTRMIEDLKSVLEEAHGTPLLKQRQILFIASDPLDTDPLQLGKEMEKVEEAIKSTRDRDTIILEKCVYANLINVTDDIGNLRPEIIHFSGHGTKTGLQLVDNNGLSKELDPQKFGDILACFENYHPELIFLNACYSARQAEAILPYTKNVIGFFYAADPELAIDFATLFYKRIGNGNNYREAFNSTKVNLKDRLPDDGEHIQLFPR